MSQATAHTVSVGQIQADNGEYYPDDVYHETTRATGNQQWVADQWANGALPTHSTSGNRVKLYTSTGNFKGHQYPNGHGKLVHYSHIQAIRTKSGLVIGDSSCYGKGWAYCSYPKNEDARINVTDLKNELTGEKDRVYDIVEVQDDRVTFDSGLIFDLDSWGWVDQTSDHLDDPVLGL